MDITLGYTRVSGFGRAPRTHALATLLFHRACAPGFRVYKGLHAQAWELFYLVASTMPPSKEFVGLVSEYVHTVAHGDAEGDARVRELAGRTWAALKRSAKAGPRRTVRACPPVRLLQRCVTASVGPGPLLLPGGKRAPATRYWHQESTHAGS